MKDDSPELPNEQNDLALEKEFDGLEPADPRWLPEIARNAVVNLKDVHEGTLRELLDEISLEDLRAKALDVGSTENEDEFIFGEEHFEPQDEAFFGGRGDDFINGWDGDDVLFGDEGDDTLVGHEGDDILVGGAGRDVLEGGQGADEFRFNAGIDQGTTDEIVDFTPEEGDTVVFDGEGDVTFTLGEGGHLMATFTTAASEEQESVSVSVDLGDVEQEGLQVERNFEGNTAISLNTGLDR